MLMLVIIFIRMLSDTTRPEQALQATANRAARIAALCHYGIDGTNGGAALRRPCEFPTVWRAYGRSGLGLLLLGSRRPVPGGRGGGVLQLWSPKYGEGLALAEPASARPRPGHHGGACRGLAHWRSIWVTTRQRARLLLLSPSGLWASVVDKAASNSVATRWYRRSRY